MFAIVETSGRQFRVTEGDRIVVDRVAAKVGETVRLDSVLMVAGGADPAIGTPFIAGAAVEATVVAHRSGDKVIVFKYRPKKRERRKVGHRRLLSEIRIGVIRRPGQAESTREEPTQNAPAPAARKRTTSRKEKGETHGA
ncbi:MAG: 50S ribosomal protein L21 [Chloroflexi bacterium]|nr:MAG: 50S ribosomal protein L21 [Chloroflexota bacterium]